MEEYLKGLAGSVALAMEFVAVIVIAIGAGQAVLGLLQRKSLPAGPFAWKKTVWLRFGVWLLFGLEFELGADIIRSTVAPSWEQIGKLATIAVIRTFLNYFLERDIDKFAESEPSVSSNR